MTPLYAADDAATRPPSMHCIIHFPFVRLYPGIHWRFDVSLSGSARATAISSASYPATHNETIEILRDGIRDYYLASDSFGTYIKPHSVYVPRHSVFQYCCRGLDGDRFFFIIALLLAFTILRLPFGFTLWVTGAVTRNMAAGERPLLHTP